MPPRRGAKARKEAEEAKKAAEETTEDPEEWWELAEPTGEFLEKFIGFNFYHLHDSGEYSEKEFDGEMRKSVNFKAEFVELTDVDGNELDDSPDEPIEGIMSIPLSVARKIRFWIEENQPKAAKAKEKVLEDKILRLQKTGTKKGTRYPTVKLIKPEDYYDD